jgi:hypothetical protein
MMSVSIRRFLILSAALAAVVVRADDRSIADFKVPGRADGAPAPAIATPPTTTAVGAPAPSMAETAALMPERISLSVPHGAVIRCASGYRFDFQGAPTIEVIEAVGRVFDAPVACPTAVSGELTGSFFARTPADVLAKVAERAGWRLRQEGSAWLMEETGRRVPQELRWDLIKPAVLSAAAKKSR